MAILNTVWYVRDGSGIGYSAVTAWAASTAYAAGDIRRATAPSVGNERCFVCIVAGTSGASEPTWTLTKGGKTTDNTVTWMECTGMPGTCGDTTNTPAWAASNSVSLGQMIYDSGTSSLQIVTTAGTTKAAPAPSFSATAGTTTADNTATWTSLGAASNYTAWKAPHARLRLVFGTSWAAAGDTVWVASDHSETQSASANAIVASGTQAKPSYIYCGNAAASLPLTVSDITTGAAIDNSYVSTVANTVGGNAYINGVKFSTSGTGTSNINLGNSSGQAILTFVNCTFDLATTGTSARIVLFSGSGALADIMFDNCTVKFNNTSQGLSGNTSSNSGTFTWKNTGIILATGSAVPTTLYTNYGRIIWTGLDLSSFGSGKTLVNFNQLYGGNSNAQLINCKLGASVTVASTPNTAAGRDTSVMVINSDSTNTNYQNQKYAYGGTLTPETTIVRTGGATNGTTASSWKIVTTANSNWVFPFECFPISIWNSTTGSNVTLTVYGIWGGASVPNNDDIWMEVDYLGSSSVPQSTLVTTTKATPISSNAACSSDSSSTWGGSTTKFKMSVTVTPQMAGDMYVRVKCAKASTTFYIDPLPVLS